MRPRHGHAGPACARHRRRLRGAQECWPPFQGGRLRCTARHDGTGRDGTGRAAPPLLGPHVALASCESHVCMCPSGRRRVCGDRDTQATARGAPVRRGVAQGGGHRAPPRSKSRTRCGRRGEGGAGDGGKGAWHPPGASLPPALRRDTHTWRGRLEQQIDG
eukprot:scaffold640_cov178-Prasinococcus_capsulatus_cf.AAC.1